jgi:hypothetical protein
MSVDRTRWRRRELVCLRRTSARQFLDEKLRWCPELTRARRCTIADHGGWSWRARGGWSCEHVLCASARVQQETIMVAGCQGRATRCVDLVLR